MLACAWVNYSAAGGVGLEVNTNLEEVREDVQPWVRPFLTGEQSQHRYLLHQKLLDGEQYAEVSLPYYSSHDLVSVEIQVAAPTRERAQELLGEEAEKQKQWLANNLEPIKGVVGYKVRDASAQTLESSEHIGSRYNPKYGNNC